MSHRAKAAGLSGALLIAATSISGVLAASHREAPLISGDPGADNTDLYAFVTPGATNTLTITWNSKPGRTYRIEGSNNLQQWSVVASQVAATGISTTYQWSIPAAWSAQAFIKVTQEP